MEDGEGVKEMRRNIEYLKKLEKLVLIAAFDKESQLGRSFGIKKRPKNFNHFLIKAILRLLNNIDNDRIKNSDIRAEIYHLKEKTGCSIGQSQKVINVYLKFYCLWFDKPLKIIKELDCPLDSTTMEQQDTMRWLNDKEKYVEYQESFLTKNKSIRILRDIEYDEERLITYLKIKKKTDLPIILSKYFAVLK